MKYRLRDVMGSLEYDERLKIKYALNSGGIHLMRFVDKSLSDRKHEHESHCSNCSSLLDLASTSNFTLVFGPEDFRKKASFCGLDCLEYFLKELKRIRKVV